MGKFITPLKSKERFCKLMLLHQSKDQILAKTIRTNFKKIKEIKKLFINSAKSNKAGFE